MRKHQTTSDAVAAVTPDPDPEPEPSDPRAALMQIIERLPDEVVLHLWRTVRTLEYLATRS